MTLDYRIYNLQLKHPFSISRYTVDVQKTMIVRISDGEISGYGEATVNPYYHSTVEKLSASVEKIKSLHLTFKDNLHPSEFWNLVEPHLSDDYFALCAIDVAY